MNQGRSKKNDISLIKSSAAITIAMLLSKILSFVRDMLQARYLGATELSDAILLSTSLLLMLTTFVRSPFQASYLPIATDAYILYDNDQKRDFFGSIYGFAIAIGIILMILVAIFINPILRILVPGVSGDSKEVLKILMLIELPVILFSFLGAVNDSNLKIYNRFGISEISNAILALFIIIYFLIWKSNVSVISLGLCVVISYLIVFILRSSILYRAGLRVRINFRLRNNENVKQISKAMIPFVIATSAKELNSLVDKAVASLLDAGSITIQSYASKMTVTEVGLIATAISMVIYSQVAKKNTENDIEGLKRLVIQGLKFVNTLMIPCCVFTIIFKNEIIGLLFGRGAFTQENVIVTANTMMIYAIGMCGSGIDEILTRTMHATKHRNYPAIISGVTVFINTGLNLLLYRRYGVYGLAAASSFVLILKVPLYAIYVHKKIVKFKHEDKIAIDFLKTFLVTGIAGSITYIIKSLMSSVTSNNIIILFLSGTIGAVLCLIGYYFVGNEYAAKVLKRLHIAK